MVKLNLNALTKNTQETPKTTQDSEIAAVSQTQIQEREQEVSPQKTRKKLSLKDLSIASGEIKEASTEETTLSTTNVLSQQEETEVLSEKKVKIGIKSLLKNQVSETQESEEKVALEISGNSNDTPASTTQEEALKGVDMVSEQSLPEEEKTFAISDGDTNVKIIAEEKDEIFGNYKGSFTPVEEIEEEDEEVTEIITQTVIAPPETVVVSSESIKQETKVMEEPTQPVGVPTQVIAENKTVSKKKKTFIAGFGAVCLMAMSGFLVVESGLLKGNLQEIPAEQREIETPAIENPTQSQPENIEEQVNNTPPSVPPEVENEVTSTPPETTNQVQTPSTEVSTTETQINPSVPETQNQTVPDTTIDPQGQETIPTATGEIAPIQETPGDNTSVTQENNTITMEENPIVKENTQVGVDNNTISSKISPKVKDYLLKKYKNK